MRATDGIRNSISTLLCFVNTKRRAVICEELFEKLSKVKGGFVVELIDKCIKGFQHHCRRGHFVIHFEIRYFFGEDERRKDGCVIFEETGGRNDISVGTLMALRCCL